MKRENILPVPGVVLQSLLKTVRVKMRSRIINSCQSAATSEILKRCRSCKGAITSKIKHAIKQITSPAILAQLLLPSLAFCFSLQPITAYRPVLDLFYVLLHVLFYLWLLLKQRYSASRQIPFSWFISQPLTHR